MDEKSLNRVLEVFKEKDNFLITAHINPEGDSVGSQLAIHALLKKLGKRSAVVNHDEVPENLLFLPGSRSILREVPRDFKAEVLVVVDCPVKERTGRVHGLVEGEPFVVNIDHHVSNEFFGDVNWVEPEASSVGEMIFSLIKNLGITVDKDLATVIYAAIVTDTGMFNYDNTSSNTHKVAGELIASGVNPKTMHKEIFESKSTAEVRLLGRALTTLEVEHGGRLAQMTLTRDMYRQEGVDIISTDEFINFPRSIRGVEVAVFFKEGGDSSVNVSFRSSGRVDVNVLASHFGGGGHAQASGCLIECTLSEAKEKVLSEVRKSLDREGKN